MPTSIIEQCFSQNNVLSKPFVLAFITQQQYALAQHLNYIFHLAKIEVSITNNSSNFKFCTISQVSKIGSHMHSVMVMKASQMPGEASIVSGVT